MKTLASSFLSLALVSGAGCARVDTNSPAAGATVTRGQARQTALAKVPGGAVQEAELERENGRWVWSFDISQPGEKDITEVQVDARTGEVVSVTRETPAEQARERKQDGK